MSRSPKSKKQAPPGPQPVALAKRPEGNSLRFFGVMALLLILPAAASWAFMEYVVWNKLPSEIVGKWEVVQGPPEFREAVLDFYRSGKMVGHFNDNDNLRIMKADVRVEDSKLYVTTRRPSTGEEHVSVQTIRTLTEREFVLVDEKAGLIKLKRIP